MDEPSAGEFVGGSKKIVSDCVGQNIKHLIGMLYEISL